MKLKAPSLILGVSLLLALVSSGFSQVTNTITITNASFENPAVTDGSYETTSLPNWSTSISGSAVYAVINPGGAGTTATSRQVSAGAGVAYTTFTGTINGGTLTFTANILSGQSFTDVNGFQLYLTAP